MKGQSAPAPTKGTKKKSAGASNNDEDEGDDEEDEEASSGVNLEDLVTRVDIR